MMEFVILYLLLFIIVLAGLGFYYSYIYNKYQGYLIRINEAESAIDNNLRNRFDLLNRAISIIKGNIKIDDEEFEELIKLRSRRLSTFELDRKLVDFVNVFYKIKEENPELLNSETFISIDEDLQEIDENLVAIKDYFNKNITAYNSLIRHFPSNMIGRLSGYKEKKFLDGKDMNDEIEKDFVL